MNPESGPVLVETAQIESSGKVVVWLEMIRSCRLDMEPVVLNLAVGSYSLVQGQGFWQYRRQGSGAEPETCVAAAGLCIARNADIVQRRSCQDGSFGDDVLALIVPVAISIPVKPCIQVPAHAGRHFDACCCAHTQWRDRNTVLVIITINDIVPDGIGRRLSVLVCFNPSPEEDIRIDDVACTVACRKRRVSGCGHAVRCIAPVHLRGHSLSHQRKRHIDTLHKLHIINPQFLPAESELLGCAGQDESSLAVTKVNDCDVNSAYRESVNVSKLIEVPEVSIDLNVEIATVLAKEQGESFDGGAKAKVEVDVVNIHLVT